MSMRSELHTVYRHIIQPLNSFALHSARAISFHFISSNRWLCRIPLPADIAQGLQHLVGFSNDPPLIFEVVGQITNHGNESVVANAGLDPQFSSCFVEPRPDFISRTEWARIPAAVDAIAGRAPLHLDMHHVLSVDPQTGLTRLRLHWRKPVTAEVRFSCNFYLRVDEFFYF